MSSAFESESESEFDHSWVQRRECPGCGHDTASIPDRDLAPSVVEVGRRWQDFLSTVCDHPGGRDDLRRRPEPHIWSAVEYGCHTRDVVALVARRAELALLTHQPLFESWDPERAAVRAFYGEQDPLAVADDIEHAAREMAALLQPLSATELARTGTDAGVAFTVAGLARGGLHEALHHLIDARAVVPATA